MQSVMRRQPLVPTFVLGACVLCLAVSAAAPSRAFAWGNGGDRRTTTFSNTATAVPNISDPSQFTLNVLPVVTGNGLGIGTHDFILEQAIAQAIGAGANVGWIDFSQAQQGTSDPDKVPAVIAQFSEVGHMWFGPSYGSAPRAAGIIYKEIVDAKNAGDYRTASRKLGWLAHFIGDMSMPMHVCSYTQYFPAGANQHKLHVGAENDIDYYQIQSVGVLSWRSDVKDVLYQYLPGASAVTTATARQDIRKLWFGGGYDPVPQPGKSAREITIDTAADIRTNYGKAFYQNWSKSWVSGYEDDRGSDPHPSRGASTQWLVSNTPNMLRVSATKMATLVKALSDPATIQSGIDQIETPTTKIGVPKRQTVSKKSRVGKLIRAAKGKKRKQLVKKYLAAPKTLKHAFKVTIRNANTNETMRTVPLTLTWRDAKGKALKTSSVWTNSAGAAKIYYSYKTPKKKTTYSVTVSAPTTDMTGERVAKFKIDPKKFEKKLK